eukprot:COSAG06_NODE_29760_length_550_cov_3.904656_2_plen_86_part_00
MLPEKWYHKVWNLLRIKAGFIAEMSRDKVVLAIKAAFDKHHEVDKISVLSMLVDVLHSQQRYIPDGPSHGPDLIGTVVTPAKVGE